MEHRGVRGVIGVSRTSPCEGPPCPPPIADGVFAESGTRKRACVGLGGACPVQGHRHPFRFASIVPRRCSPPRGALSTAVVRAPTDADTEGGHDVREQRRGTMCPIRTGRAAGAGACAHADAAPPADAAVFARRAHLNRTPRACPFSCPKGTSPPDASSLPIHASAVPQSRAFGAAILGTREGRR